MRQELNLYIDIVSELKHCLNWKERWGMQVKWDCRGTWKKISELMEMKITVGVGALEKDVKAMIIFLGHSYLSSAWWFLLHLNKNTFFGKSEHSVQANQPVPKLWKLSFSFYAKWFKGLKIKL